jgi:FtsZ-interacting cell division protein ZipA
MGSLGHKEVSMDTLLIIALAIIALVIVIIVALWYRKRETGSVGLDIRVPGIQTLLKAETKEASSRAEQTQTETVSSAQEQPRSANAKQSQEKTTDSSQKIT